MSGATRLLWDPVWQWAPTRPVPLKTHSDHGGMVCDAHRPSVSETTNVRSIFLAREPQQSEVPLESVGHCSRRSNCGDPWGALVVVSLGEVGQQVAFLMGAIIGSVGGVAMAFEVVKRLHDLDRPDTHY
jgi:hypothetical protein